MPLTGSFKKLPGTKVARKFAIMIRGSARFGIAFSTNQRVCGAYFSVRSGLQGLLRPGAADRPLLLESYFRSGLVWTSAAGPLTCKLNLAAMLVLELTETAGYGC